MGLRNRCPLQRHPERPAAECLGPVDGQGQPLFAEDGGHVFDEVVAVLERGLRRGLLTVPQLRAQGQVQAYVATLCKCIVSAKFCPEWPATGRIGPDKAL